MSFWSGAGGGLIAGAGDLVSGLFSGSSSRSSARDLMRFQQIMSNTAYRRAARDLEKAGLNRILALGSPASSPAGATWSMPDMKLGSSVSAGISSAKQRSVMDVQKHLMTEQADQATTQATANFETAKRERETAEREKTQAGLNIANAKLVAEQTRLAHNEAAKSDVTRALYERAGPYVDRALDWVEEHFGMKKTAKPDAQGLTPFLRGLFNVQGPVGGASSARGAQ